MTTAIPVTAEIGATRAIPAIAGFPLVLREALGPQPAVAPVVPVADPGVGQVLAELGVGPMVVVVFGLVPGEAVAQPGG